MRDDDDQQIFDSLATAKQMLDSGTKLLAMRDQQIKALEAKLGEWRARAENAEIELEAARERLEVLDEVLDDSLDCLSLYPREFVEGNRMTQDLDDDAEVARELHDAGAIIDVGAESEAWGWTRFGLELRKRAQKRARK